MIYLKHFNTIMEYNTYKNSTDFITPNVSDAEEDPTFVRFTPHTSTPIIPELIGAKILCKYNVPVTNSSIVLYWASSGSGSGSGSGNGSKNTPMFSSMEVDGVEQEVTHLYTFDTTGEHTILFTLAEGVTSIGALTFKNCFNLTSVIIGNSVTSIDDYAFEGCSGLTSITIPNSVTSIGSEAFNACYGLTSIVVAANNQTYDSRNNCNAIIKTSTNKLIVGCKNTIIPDSVTSIGDYAFGGCSGLTSITIPDSVTSIDDYAFRNCCGLTSVTIGNSVTSIGSGAFYNCSGLTSVTIGNSVTSIGEKVFFLCTELTSVTIGNSVTSIDRWVFNGCSELTSIICNATTAPTVLGSTFQGINSGGTLIIPAGSIGYDVWMGTGDSYLGKYNWTKVEQ